MAYSSDLYMHDLDKKAPHTGYRYPQEQLLDRETAIKSIVKLKPITGVFPFGKHNDGYDLRE